MVMITGARRGEGRTTLALCLARCAAQAGVSTALVDADLKNPQLGSRLGMETPCGWLQVVAGKAPLSEAAVSSLSGGNQQKVVLAKWLEADCAVVVFDEPTRGIDVGAKREIHLLVNDLASRGKAVVMISSELPEVLGMSDRILVLGDGRVRGEIESPERSSQEEILSMAVS